MALRPLIAIFGTTGVGKSKLAIELALALSRTSRHGWQGARVINADSMQVYSGMDIITNKLSETEMQGIEHLLMRFKQPGEQYTVGEWVNDALKAIEETHQRNQIPVVVGGTLYWIQHLIFPDRLMSKVESEYPGHSISNGPVVSEDLAKSLAALPVPLLELFNTLPEQPPAVADSAFSLHCLLSALDPAVAARWHWRDSRKVLASLKIISNSGRRASDIISEQSETLSRPRYRTLCFWLFADRMVLNTRLDTRVDHMIEQGLLGEIRTLQEMAMQPSALSPNLISSGEDTVQVDYTLGIYQSIGYKEFHHYVLAENASDKEFTIAVERMKQSTRQYAKRQVSWIRNKLLPHVFVSNTGQPTNSLPCPIYVLDATELGEMWDLNVRGRAEMLAAAFLDEEELPDPHSLSNVAHEMLTINQRPISPNAVLTERRKIICHVCTVNKDRPVMVDQGQQWDVHQRTRLHRRLAKKTTGGSPAIASE